MFCSARNIVGFVGSGFHTLLLCADLPEKIFYLTRNRVDVNPQFPLIDQSLNIDGHYLRNVIRNSARVSLVDFGTISLALMNSGLVHRPFDAEQYDLETEFSLLTNWLTIKAKDKQRLETVVAQILNQVIVKEADALLG